MVVVESDGSLSRADQKRLGIRLFQVIRSLRQLKKEGEIEKGMSAADITLVLIASKMEEQEYASEWQAVGAPDWDSIFAFIEKLVELFLKIWPLFLV
jgi:hypothetical protein